MADISLFENHWSVDTPDNLPLEVYLNEVKTGTYEDICHKIRSVSDKARRDKMKEKIPGVTFSGIFSKRNNESIIEHSGFICMDLDNLSDPEGLKELLSQDRYVYACFLSTSGNGLRVLFRITGSRHKDAYYGLADYFIKHYNEIPDPQSMVVSRSFCVTFDPNIYIAKHTVPIFTLYIKEKEVEKDKKKNNFVYAEDDFNNILTQITQRNVNICDGYQEWLKTGFGLADKFGEGGRDFFHTISRISSKYETKKTDKQYDYCLKHKSKTVATISTVFYYAKEAGLQVTSERTQKIRKRVLIQKSAGVSKSQIIKNLEKNDGITECEALVEEIFTSAKEIGEGDEIIDQLEAFITNSYDLRRNEITKYIESNGVPMTQTDINSIFIAAKRIIGKLDYHLMDRLLLSDFVLKYNPIKEFFDQYEDDKREKHSSFNPQNKNINSPFIAALAATIENDMPSHTEYFLRKWIVSIVSAAYGVHSPLVFVLVGGQGTGKTEWFRRLFPGYHPNEPTGLAKYYAESKLDAGKDDEILMTQKLVIMDDEFFGKNKVEFQRFKELTSKNYFSLREPYGRSNVDLKRLSVLCGTSNFKEILADPSGNRRIIPIDVKGINIDAYNLIDKFELFREAYNLWKDGFDWRVVSKDDIEYLGINDSEYEMVILEKELIHKYYSKPPNDNCDWLTASEIKVELEMLTQQKLNLTKIGQCLGKLGFIQKSKRDGKDTSKKWAVIKENRGNPNAEKLKDDLPF